MSHKRSPLMSSKSIVFIAVMSALGNVLSGLSIAVAPIIPSIPIGPITFSLAVDLSHITTFIAAIFGGPAFGGLTGMIGGLVASYMFGFSHGNLVTGFGLPLGKALTGIASGFIMRTFRNRSRRLLLLVPAAVVSFLPEALYIVLLFVTIFPLVYGPQLWVTLFTLQIIVKAFIEMVIMGLILAALLGNQGFTEYVRSFFA